MEQPTSFVKKSKQFSQGTIASDIALLMLTLSVNKPLAIKNDAKLFDTSVSLSYVKWERETLAVT